MTPYLISAVGGLIMVLIGLVSWIGSRLWEKMDKVEVKVDDHNTAAVTRLTRVEEKVDAVENRIEHIESHVFGKRTRTT